MNKSMIIGVPLLLLLFSGCRNNSSGGDSLDFPTDNTVTVKIKISSPESGEIWEPGTTHTIKWELSHEIQLVNIELFKKGDFRFSLAENIGSGTGTFNWKVPDDLPSSRHYRFKIVNSLKPAEYQFSNYFFVIK